MTSKKYFKIHSFLEYYFVKFINDELYDGLHVAFHDELHDGRLSISQDSAFRAP